MDNEKPQYRVEVVPLTQFQPDPDNLNLHRERGMSLLEHALRQRGFGRPMFATGDDVMLAGNATQEKALEVGFTHAIVITTHGDVPIIHRRADLSAADPQARLMAMEDNRIAEVNLAPDATGLLALCRLMVETGADAEFDRLYTPDEMRVLLDKPLDAEDAGAPPSKLEAAQDALRACREKTDALQSEIERLTERLDAPHPASAA